MDHSDAMGENIAERYFLGELTDEEAEAYEAHFFECETCAEYVREELTMLESGRAVALEEKRTAVAGPLPAAAPVVALAARPPRRAWVPLAAAAILAVGLGTPLLVRNDAPEIERGQFIEVQPSLERAATTTPVLRAGVPATILVPILSTDYPRFELSIRNAAKERIGDRLRVPAAETSEPIPLQSRPLPAGRYEVVIEGVREDGNRTEIAVSPFQVH